jgi:hypothetical protein
LQSISLPVHQAATPDVEKMQINALLSATIMALKTATIAHADAIKSTGHR